MKRLFLLFVFAVAALAQNPDCQINFGPWVDVNVSPSSANNITQCTYWVMTYQVTGFTVISLQFESATGTNAGGPGAFGAYSGTVSSGVNPSVSVVCATVTNCTATFTGQVGWYRVNFPSHTGSGTVQGVLKGYKVGYTLGGAPVPGGGCVGTVATPCIVAGVAADGAAAAGSPVLVAGQDGTNAQTLLTDTTGRQVVVGAAASGAALTGSPVRVGLSDGVNTRNALYCPNQAIISTAASGSTQIVAASGSTVVYVCQVSLSNTAAVDIKFVSGTGANCVTGPVDLTGTYRQVLAAVLPFEANAPLTTAAAKALCINLGAAIDVQGLLTYAQF